MIQRYISPYPLPNIDNTHRAPESSYSKGRAGLAIKLFIRHNTESTGAGNAPSLAWFLNPVSQVSIPHLIARDGTRLDMVHRVDTAWQCGDSAWGTESGSVLIGVGTDRVDRVARLNAISLGMEFESSSNRRGPGNGYTIPQLQTGAYTEACSLVSYPGLIIVDHRDIALPRGRRVDPSNFPLAQYLGYRQEWLDFLHALPAAELAHWCI